MILVENKTIPLQLIISESMLGNSKMQKLLYHQFAARMYAVCLRYTKNADDAEDILQEGFIKIFRNLDKFRGDGSFEGWIRKIITRTAISHLRDNKKKLNTQPAELNGFLEDRESNILEKLAEKDIVGIVTKLPPGYRKVFMMYVMEGYNHKEIAGILGCSEGNCKSQLYRSRTQLQKILKKSA
ncbi:MAG TPA: RNA polymerase sigma factor [Ferruginibacter sp.]|nr:RNA polymerase sigma factor [Ferruginibacter sp.]